MLSVKSSFEMSDFANICIRSIKNGSTLAFSIVINQRERLEGFYTDRYSREYWPEIGRAHV